MRMEGTGRPELRRLRLAGIITLYLIGDANDYTGKGPVGRPHRRAASIDFRGDATRQHHHRQHLLLRRHQWRGFFRGVAGERFAVRLSGATAVVVAPATTAAST